MYEYDIKKTLDNMTAGILRGKWDEELEKAGFEVPESVKQRS